MDIICQDRIKFLEEHWKEIENRAILPIWHKHNKKYLSLGISLDDFKNISYIMLDKAINTFQPDKSSFFTYSRCVISRKMYTYIRDISERDKSKANNCPDSLNIKISEDSNTEKMDLLKEADECVSGSLHKICKYLEILSDTQKDILMLKTLGFNDEDIIDGLKIKKKDLNSALKNMRVNDNSSILY